MWENIVELGRPQMTIWCMSIACHYLKLQRQIRICNTNCNNGYKNAPQCYVIRRLPVLCSLSCGCYATLSINANDAGKGVCPSLLRRVSFVKQFKAERGINLPSALTLPHTATCSTGVVMYTMILEISSNYFLHSVLWADIGKGDKVYFL